MLELARQSQRRLVEFLTAVGERLDRAGALDAAAALAAGAFDAEVGAVVRDGRLAAAHGPAPVAQLIAVHPKTGPVRLDGLGCCHVASAAWDAGTAGRIVVARRRRRLSPEERLLLVGMARGLGLVLRMIDALETERALCAEHRRRADERARLLEALLDIQRSIARRAPLHETLDAVTAGASTLLGVDTVALTLDDALDPARPIVASATPAARRRPPERERALVAPVHVNGKRAGALVAAPMTDALGAPARALLSAFAEHAGLALADARTVQAMEEAFHDPLTGLPNRALFVDRLEQALGGSRDRRHVAVLFVDLDRFKAVNDGIGHRAGDELLRAVAGRIVGCLRRGDTAARFGGDEFAVFLQGRGPAAGAEHVADRIIATMRRPFAIGGRTVAIGASVGVAHSDRGARTADELLRNADLAMYRAKRDGRGRRATFAPEMLSAALERVELETALQSALERAELEVHYQPLLDLDTGRPVAVEALLRWTHPVLGRVPPSTFVPIAEETGAILSIGRWVLDVACARVAALRAQVPGLALSVNVSAPQLREARFPEEVRAALERTGLPGSALTLELTETMLVDEHGDALRQLLRLKELGVAIAVDDFGTGYSALRYLQQLPVDVLKIDRSFVGLLGDDGRDDAVVRTIIELGRVMRLDTVAEGIETPGQLRRVHGLGCRVGQGFHFARPMPGDALAAYFAQAA